MQFSITAHTKIDNWEIFPYVEDLGFDAAWVPDSQMIWSDCYATLALAAQHTSRLRIGTGVAIPGTRIAPVTAHSIASINRLAPGRTFLGVGTGHTAMRVMGMQPMKVRDFREYLRVVRTLLRGEEVEYSLDGTPRTIQFLHQELKFIDLEQPIPIYVAANGPLALRTAGEFGDGLVSLFNEQAEVLQANVSRVQAGAERVGRTLPENFHTTALTTAVVLKPGEDLTSDRVIEACGSWVTCALHFVYEIYEQTGDESGVPEAFQDVWEEYRDQVENMPTPQAKRYLQIHDGHCTYHVPEERKFITPKTIKGSCMVGEPAELIGAIRQAEQAGLKEISLLPPLKTSREVYKDFAEQVIAKY